MEQQVWLVKYNRDSSLCPTNYLAVTLGQWLKAPKPQFLHLLNWNTNTHKGFWRFLGAYWVSIPPISIWGSSFPTLHPSGLAGGSTTSLQECRTQSRRLCEAPGHETSSGMSTWPHLIRVPLSTRRKLSISHWEETLEDHLAGEAPVTCPHVQPENKGKRQRKVEPVREIEGDKVQITSLESSSVWSQPYACLLSL